MVREEQPTIRDEIIDVFETLLSAQLRALRRAKGGETEIERKPQKSRSQLDLVSDILHQARKPLHITDIIHRAKQKFGVELDRESLVSALTKRVQRKDRFQRVGPNTFALLQQPPGG